MKHIFYTIYKGFLLLVDTLPLIGTIVFILVVFGYVAFSLIYSIIYCLVGICRDYPIGSTLFILSFIIILYILGRIAQK